MTGPRFFTMLLAALLWVAAGCAPANSYLRQRAVESMEVGRLTRAEARLERALEQRPADWEAQRLMGMLRLRQERPFDAQMHLERALALEPPASARETIVDGLAEALYRQGEEAALYRFLETQARRWPGPHAWLRQATYFTRLGDVDNAETAYRKAVRMAEPGDVEPWLAMAEFLGEVGDHARAVEVLRYAYGVAPEDERVHERLRDHGEIPGPTLALPEK